MSPQKIFVLFLLFLFIENSLNAQNWQPISTIGNTNFRKVTTPAIQGYNNTISPFGNTAKSYPFTTLFIENTVQNGLETIYGFNTTYFSSGQTFYTHIPHFLQAEMIDKGNGIYQFCNPDTFTIHTQALLNDSWLYNPGTNDTATLISIYQDTVLGSLDLIKHIALSSGDYILLSKNYGFIRFPDNSNNNTHYELAGIEYSPSSSIGIQLPNTLDIFDFEVGDEFVYLERPPSPYYERTYKKYIITSKQVLPTGGYNYTVDFQAMIDESSYAGPPPYYHTTAGTTTWNRGLNQSNSVGADNPNGAAYNSGALIDITRVSVSEDNLGRFYKFKSEISFFSMDNGDSSHSALGPNQSPIQSTCSPNFGIIKQHLSSGRDVTMIGALKSGVVYGDTAVYSRFTTIPTKIIEGTNQNIELSIFPLPAKQYFNLAIKTDRSCLNKIKIRIISTNGILVKEQLIDYQNQASINVSDIPNGLYSVNIEIDDFSENRGLVVQHE